MRLTHFFVACLVAATPVLGAGQTFADRSNSIAVVVLAGHEVELARVGAMVFANKRAVVRSPDPLLLEHIYDAVKEELEKEARVRVSRVLVPLEQIPQLSEAVESAASGLFGPDQKKLTPLIEHYRASCSCDAILLIAPLRRPIGPNSNQLVKGLVWLGRGGITGEAVSRTMAISNLTLLLFDAKNGALVDTAPSSRDRPAEFQFTSVPATAWPIEMTGLSAEQWLTFVEAQAKELRLSVRSPLFRLGFRPSCVQHFYRIANPGPGRDMNQDPFAQRSPPPFQEGADPSKCT